MRPIRTRVNSQDPEFRAAHARMRALVDRWAEHMARSRWQGEPAHTQRHQAAGKMLVRDRIERLLDRDSPFLELMPLAGWGTRDQLGGQNVAGIGLVSGTPSLLIGNQPTIKGGAMDHTAMLKMRRLSAVADENRLPVIFLSESAGAFLPDQANVFNWFGEMFREITRRSRRGLPTLTIVFGSCTAGGAYIPGVSDYSILVKGQAKVFLAGPPLVKMATNEVVDDEALGGAEMHSRLSGVSDYLAADESDGIRLAREILESIRFEPSGGRSGAPGPVEEPIYDPEEILGIAQTDVRVPFEAREIIARIVDGSRFHEFKALYGPTLVTGFARIHGYPVGILANNGILFSESANKGAHFIQLCNQSGIPLLFLQNITGFMVGRRYEEGGIVKNGAKLVNAVSNSSTPAVTVVIGASYGAGNYAMCGLAYQPRFLYTWPNMRLAVMGAEQLAGVMDIIRRGALERSGGPIDESRLEAERQEIVDRIHGESDAWYCSGRVWDDGVIDPRQTRNVVGLSLAVIYRAGFEGQKAYGVFRM